MQAPQGQVAAQACRYDEISPPPFLLISHLLLQDRSQANLGHSGPAQNSLPLDEIRRRDDDHVIAPLVRTAFKQQRHVQHGNRLAASSSKVEKALFLDRDHRVNDALEASEPRRVCKDKPTEMRSIDFAGFSSDTGKSVRDWPDSSASRFE
jgi:hypothetical protein